MSRSFTFRRAQDVPRPAGIPPTLGLGALIVLGGAALGGCRVVQQPQFWIESALSEIRWYRDGFLLSGSNRKFRYLNQRQREEGQLFLEDEYRGKVTYVDYGMNDRVDEIRTRDGTIKRGGPGSDELFAHADREWGRHKEELGVPSYVQKWQAAGPERFVELRGVGSY